MKATSDAWRRAPEHDRRIARGDDFAADAWRRGDQIKLVAVGRDVYGERIAQGGAS